MQWALLVIITIILASKVNKLYRNPYKLILIAGEKGNGKSLRVAYLANKHKGYVYSNMGVGQQLEPDYWSYEYPKGSLLILDEIGLKHNNRDFKSFPYEAIEFFKYQRKNQLYVILTSQTMDFDKKIRDMLDYIVVVKRLPGFLNWVSYGFKYKHNFEVVDTPEGGSRLQDVERRSGLDYIRTIPAMIKGADYDTERKIDK
ncbi:MAG: hypothetical protein QXI16_03750 [Sulfolobaceae archaeon]